MPKITFSEHSYECLSDETVLECLIRNNVEVPSSCQAGACQTCMMKVTQGSVPGESQAGLKPTQIQQGYFLVCTCTPTEDISITLAGEDAVVKTKATLIEKSALSDKIVRLKLQCQSPFEFQPGQFINLHRADGLVRSYSIASLPSEGVIELHIELIENGKMSSWLLNDFKVGEHIEIDGPHGDCFYLNDKPQQNLLLIGTGSGLAPLWGIARQALAQGHQGEIHLFHGSRDTDKVYMKEALEQLAEQHPNFHYTPCLSGEEQPGYLSGRANELALQQHPKLAGWRIYLCGHPDMVNGTKKKAFLAGAAINDILADPFTF